MPDVVLHWHNVIDASMPPSEITIMQGGCCKSHEEIVAGHTVMLISGRCCDGSTPPIVITLMPGIRFSYSSTLYMVLCLKISSQSMAPNNAEQNNIEENSSVTITIHEENLSLLASSIQETIPKKGSHICSIYRVPHKLRSEKGKIYDARFVSIGPYHRLKKNFMVTENHKRWYLSNLMKRLSPPRPSLPTMLKSMKDLESEARECYAEETNISSDEFVTMMLVDGCFMLELLYKYREVITEPRQNRENVDSSHGARASPEDRDEENDDLIFSSGNVIRRIQKDFVLLENQLPLVILRSLFELTKNPKHSCSLNMLILDFLDDLIPTTLIRKDDSINGKHLLDLVRSAIIPSQKTTYGQNYPLHNTARYSAIQLYEVGVILKANKDATSLMDITFDMKAGVLKIPYFFHGRCLATLIPNLIALEKAHLPYTKEITSYALFLNALVNTKEDVKLLYDGGIIYDWGSTNDISRTEEEILDEINTMCAGVMTKMFYYKDLCDNINSYCKIYWRPRIKRIIHRSTLSFLRDYFNSPWKILSLLGAIILLVLTLVQTIYTIR